MRPRQFKYHSASMVLPWPRDFALLQNSKFHAVASGISMLNCQRGMEGHLHLLCLAGVSLPIASEGRLGRNRAATLQACA